MVQVSRRAGDRSDRDLLDGWRDGDQVSGRLLFETYFAQLHRFFANKCTEPDELVQTTFMALLGARDQFAGRSSFRTYLFTIARHELYRYLKTLQRTRRFDPAVSSIAQITTSLGSKLARNQEHARLCAALRTLSVEHQTLLELHYWEDLDAAALGEIFEVDAGTIRVRLHRARAALRDALAQASQDLPVATVDAWARRARG